MKIILKCCDMTCPIGITEPSFSWILKDCPDKKQTAYRITVYSDHEEIVWDSRIVPSEQSAYIKYEGPPLKENTRYWWKVVVSTANNHYESPLAHFITGLYDTNSLKWVSPDKLLYAPLVCKEFHLDQVQEYATLNICGLGFFEVYINGRKVSDELMSPVRTDYDAVQYKNLTYPYSSTTRKSVKYLTYEVSEYLKPGMNQITIWLGNGWYRQKGRTVEGIFDYGNELKLFFRLTNGTQVVESGEDCHCYESPILYDNLFYGEIYDARIVAPQTDGQPVHMAAPPAGSIEPQLCPPERVIDTYVPILHNGIYDTGKCMTGFAEISCTGNAGDKIEIFYAEELNASGELDYTSTVGYVESDKDQIQMDVYVLSGNGEERYAPRFVWHAFRYFKICAPESVSIGEVTAHYVCSDIQPRTTFKCSSDLLNRIHEAAVNTQMTNTHGCVPMDCPHRERLGYTGDGQLSSLAVMYNFDAHQMYHKWVHDIMDAQNLTSGFVPHTAPFNGGGGGPAWGSSIATVPWNIYMQYGDTEILRQSAPSIKMWLQYLTTRLENGLVTHEEPGSWCLGDWCMPSKYPWSEPHLDEIKIPSSLVNTVYYIHCIDIYNRISHILGTETAFEKERAIAANAVNGLLHDGIYATEEQGCNIFPLFVEIVPDEAEEQVWENTIQSIKDHAYCFETGIFGTSFLLKLLDRYNQNDIALKMFLNTEYPSLGNMIKNGATSLWETWEGNGSKNHTAFSSMDAWFFYGLAGLKPMSGYKEFSLKPHFAPEMSFLSTALECEYGTISLKWIRKGNSIEVEIQVPFNTVAHVDLNNKCFDLEAGIYKEVVYETL